MSDPTPETVHYFYDYMSRYYGSRYAKKQSSTNMQVVASILGLFGIMNKNEFLDKFTITVGNTIYLSFSPGDPSVCDLWNQILVCVHEHLHVLQFRKEGITQIGWKYARSETRMFLEVAAYQTLFELTYWRFKTVPPVTDVINSLRKYSLSERDLDTARAMFAIYNVMVEQGVIFSESARVAIAWLDKNASYLKV